MVGKVVFLLIVVVSSYVFKKLSGAFQLLTAILKMGQTSQGHSDHFCMCTSRNLKKKKCDKHVLIKLVYNP